MDLVSGHLKLWVFAKSRSQACICYLGQAEVHSSQELSTMTHMVAIQGRASPSTTYSSSVAYRVCECTNRHFCSCEGDSLTASNLLEYAVKHYPKPSSLPPANWLTPRILLPYLKKMYLAEPFSVSHVATQGSNTSRPLKPSAEEPLTGREP